MDSSRPSDHFDSPAAATVTQPRLGLVGYLRWAWRLLTSMRTALVLLLLLAIAAIPGSLVPQTSSDPNGVVQYKAENPELAAVLDWFGVFNTYTSVWFSAIYILLFVSLIGCVIPRTKHHFDALRSRPPRTPARLARLEGFTTRETAADAALAIDEAEKLLRSMRYRVERFDSLPSSASGSGGVLPSSASGSGGVLPSSASGSGTATYSVSAERGYLRETGNLVFHAALIGVLLSVGVAGGFGYAGQRVVVEGQAFANSLASYDSFLPQRFFSEAALTPFTIQLDSFDAVYEEENIDAYGHPIDFTANVTTTLRGEEPTTGQVKVNEPLAIGGTSVYLLGNGYAPHVVIRDPDGAVVFSQPVAFLPQDSNLFSLGIIKIPDGLAEQLGIRGLLYPTTFPLANGTYASSHPSLRDPTLTLEVYSGDLGLDNGQATNAYALNTDSLTQIAGRDAATPTIELAPGDVAELPNGLGTIELLDIPRFVSLDVHHDPSQGWVLLFSALVLGGLVTSLFVARRRVWVKAVVGEDGATTLEYAGLARGDDPRLQEAVAELADRHIERLKVDS